MGRDLDRDLLAGERLAGDGPGRPRPRGDRGDARHRAEQVDEVGDVVGRHVEHRAAAAEVVEAGVRVPALVAGAHEEGGAGERLADGAVVDQPAAGLVGAAEEGVRRAADAEPLRPGRIEERTRLGGVDRERLLGVDMLAGGDRPEAHLDMGERHGEVDHDLDSRVGEEALDRRRRDAELRAARLGRRGVEVGDRLDVEDREGPRRLEIGGADIAAADDADADPVHDVLPLVLFYRRRAGPVVFHGAP